MSRRVKIMIQGQAREAEAIEVHQTSEHWSQYLLEDGAILKLKPVTTDIFRVIGEYDAEGNPVYVVKSRNILAVQSPEQLRKPAD